MSRIAKVAAVALGTGAAVVSGAGLAMADAGAQGAAVGSPGFLSGNVVQVPVHIPVNVCGNTLNGLALLNPAFGNTCANVSGHDKGKEHGGDYGHDRHGSSSSNGGGKRGGAGYGD
ncbi:chaplin [Streptomyces sp. YKOK-I1]